jgi:hypothetical protein
MLFGQKFKSVLIMGGAGAVIKFVGYFAGIPTSVTDSILTFFGVLTGAYLGSQATSDIMTKGATSSITKNK